MVNKILILDDLLVAACVFITLSPVYVWGHEKLIYTGAFLVLIFATSDVFRTISTIKLNASILIFSFSFSFLILNDASYFGALFFGIFLAVITLISNERLVNIFQYLKIIFAVSIFPGLILWFLHQTMGSDILYLGELPENLISNEFKKGAGEGYAMYPFTIVLDYMLEWPVYRMQGPFDEPGWLGTICALLIAGAGFDKKRIVDYIVIISGFLSFSLAFYIMISIYLFAMSRRFFIIFFIIFILLAIIANFLSLDVIDSYILQRLEITNSGIAGYNRDGNILNEKFSNFMSAPVLDIFFGLTEKIYDGSSSFKLVLVNSGFVGIFLIFSLYFIIIYLQRNFIDKKFLIFILIFFLSSLQRPDVVKPFMFFIFLASPIVLSTAKLKIKNYRLID